MGRIILRKAIDTGINHVSINTSGVYLVTVNAGGKSFTEKVIVTSVL